MYEISQKLDKYPKRCIILLIVTLKTVCKPPFALTSHSLCVHQAVEILKPDYTPSDVDILYAERVTSSNGLSCLDFSFPEPAYDDDTHSGDLHDSLLR